MTGTPTLPAHIRTILIVLAAIFVPCAILVYLSISSISQQGMILRHVLRENHQRRLREIAGQLRHRIETEERASRAAVSEDGSEEGDRLYRALRMLPDAHPLVQEAFYLGVDGSVLFPPPVRETEEPSPEPLQGDHLLTIPSFFEGRRLEFVDQDPQAAVERYRTALEKASSVRDRARILHAMARCWFKVRAYGAAAEAYQGVWSLTVSTPTLRTVSGMHLEILVRYHIGLCQIRLSRPKRGEEILLSLYRDLIENPWGKGPEQLAFFRSRTRQELQNLFSEMPDEILAELSDLDRRSERRGGRRGWG